MSSPDTEMPRVASATPKKSTHPVILELQKRRKEKLERYHLLRSQVARARVKAPTPSLSLRPLVRLSRSRGGRLARSAPEHKPPSTQGEEGFVDSLRPTTANTRIPYHTAITRPPPPSKGQPQFDALNRPFVPLPRLLDASPPADAYRKVSIRPWLEQVTRVVPERPVFSESMGSHVEVTLTPSDPAASQDFVHAYPSVFFFRSYRGRRRPGANREYVISPDWVSESPRHRSLDSCALRYGWGV